MPLISSNETGTLTNVYKRPCDGMSDDDVKKTVQIHLASLSTVNALELISTKGDFS